MSDKGKVVLITGASSGMGKETARTLIKEGYTVYTAARRVEKMKDLKRNVYRRSAFSALSDRGNYLEGDRRAPAKNEIRNRVWGPPIHIHAPDPQ
jgi:NAD(P)-dependent dehydrogenase (short-subunit alcohol dehydrogenase family)